MTMICKLQKCTGRGGLAILDGGMTERQGAGLENRSVSVVGSIPAAPSYTSLGYKMSLFMFLDSEFTNLLYLFCIVLALALGGTIIYSNTFTKVILVLKIHVLHRIEETFYYVRFIIRRRAGLLPPPLPNRDKDKSKKTKTKNHLLVQTIMIFGAAMFGITLYLTLNLGIELSAEDGMEYVKRYGNEYLDMFFGEIKEEGWYYDEELQRYVYGEIDSWTDDELSSDEDDAGSDKK